MSAHGVMQLLSLWATPGALGEGMPQRLKASRELWEMAQTARSATSRLRGQGAGVFIHQPWQARVGCPHRGDVQVLLASWTEQPLMVPETTVPCAPS